MIQLSNISKKFGSFEAVKPLSLTLPKGNIYCLTGPSGAGKTTLLQMIGTLEKPDSGNIYINNTSVTNLTQKKLALFRNQEIGFVFQFHHLLPEFTALENVMLPALIGKETKKNAEIKALKILDYLALGSKIHNRPNELSGGEQQRVAVARALVNSPSVVLADEPTGNLDSANAKHIHEYFLQLREELQQTFIIVTHNEELAKFSDQQIRMKDGSIL